MNILACAPARAAVLAAIALSPPVTQAAWTYIPIPAGLAPYIQFARVCKTTVSSVYGPLWRPNYQVLRRDRRTNIISISTRRNLSQTLNQQSNSQWLGDIAGTGAQAYASPFFDDRWVFAVGFSPAVPDAVNNIPWNGYAFDAMFQAKHVAPC